MNIGSMVLWTFWGILFYSAADTPYWKKGCIVLLVCCAVMFGYMWLVYWVRILIATRSLQVPLLHSVHDADVGVGRQKHHEEVQGPPAWGCGH